jgi:hypothetical protein
MKKLPLLIALIALPLLLAACEGAAFLDAEKANTPEAFEAFLQEYPNYAQADEVRVTIEELRYKGAWESRNAGQMREFLGRYPDSEHAAKMIKKEDELAWTEADYTKTGEGYKSYLDLHPTGAWIPEATALHTKFAYVDAMTISTPVIQKVNMAADPEGPLNGWGLSCEITNTGDRRVRTVEVRIDYLKLDGSVAKSDKWWAVVQDLGPLPVHPIMRPILEPGEVRPFSWSTAEAPPGWDEGKLALRISELKFAKEPAPDAEAK